MIIHKDQRIGIFIDVQNLYHSAKNLYNARVNFKELIKNVLVGRKLIRAMAYVVKTDDVLNMPRAEGVRSASGEAAFFEALRNSGLELRVKDIQVYPGGMKKADWDVGMAVDAIRMAGSLDTVILVTGDGDFQPLVEYLRWGLGKEVEIAAFSKTASAKFREATESFRALEEIPKILIKK